MTTDSPNPLRPRPPSRLSKAGRDEVNLERLHQAQMDELTRLHEQIVELHTALSDIATMVIPSQAMSMLHTDIDTEPGNFVKLDFVVSMRKIAREAINWQPDYLHDIMQQK